MIFAPQTARVASFTAPAWDDNGRRAQTRLAIPRLIQLTPMTDDGQHAAGPSIHVVGKHLAPLGIDFFHHQPIGHRLACLQLEISSSETVSLLVRLAWCRFLKPGWYDSGGRFTKVLQCRHRGGPSRADAIPRDPAEFALEATKAGLGF